MDEEKKHTAQDVTGLLPDGTRLQGVSYEQTAERYRKAVAVAYKVPARLLLGQTKIEAEMAAKIERLHHACPACGTPWVPSQGLYECECGVYMIHDEIVFPPKRK